MFDIATTELSIYHLYYALHLENTCYFCYQSYLSARVLYTHWDVLALAILSSLVGVSDALELQKIPKCSLIQILVPNERYCYGLAWQGNESIGAASINKPLQNTKLVNNYYTVFAQ